MNENLQGEHVSEGVVEEVVSRRDAVVAEGDGAELPGNPNFLIAHSLPRVTVPNCQEIQTP